jgi:sugar-specific transcriptional regulator TrmB
MNTQILEKIGFTQGEIKVYFALLELGETSTGKIISKSQVARSKVYEILEKLEKKGLVSEAIKSGTRYFQASNPERILDYIKNKEKEIQQEEQEFNKILPDLINKQKFQEQKQEVKVYTGFEGVKTFYNEILDQLQKGEEYLAMTFSDKSLDNKSIILFFQNFHLKRAEKGIKAKILSNEKDRLTQKKMDYSKTKFYEFRITKQTLPAGIAIFKDSVATFNWGETPRVFVITCKENAEQYKKFFYEIWKKAN